MTDDTKMLRAIINGQSSIKDELLSEIHKVDKKVDAGFKKVNERFEVVDTRFDQVDKRIDKLGLQIASLEDDAPTMEEFEGLEKKVVKIQKRLALG
jgi:DNA repair exonuclease SbcCD ATPase subunit